MTTKTEGVRRERIDQIARTISDKVANKIKTKHNDFILAAAYNINVSLRTMKEYVKIAMHLIEAKIENGYIIHS